MNLSAIYRFRFLRDCLFRSMCEFLKPVLRNVCLAGSKHIYFLSKSLFVRTPACACVAACPEGRRGECLICKRHTPSPLPSVRLRMKEIDEGCLHRAPASRFLRGSLPLHLPSSQCPQSGHGASLSPLPPTGILPLSGRGPEQVGARHKNKTHPACWSWITRRTETTDAWLKINSCIWSPACRNTPLLMRSLTSQYVLQARLLST